MYDVNVYYKVKTSIGRSEFIYFHLSLAAYLVLTERDSYLLTLSECDVFQMIVRLLCSDSSLGSRPVRDDAD